MTTKSDHRRPTTEPLPIAARLAQLPAMQAELGDLERRTVAEARAAGLTWQDIGFCLGMAPQNAHRKFAAPPVTPAR